MQNFWGDVLHKKILCWGFTDEETIRTTLLIPKGQHADSPQQLSQDYKYEGEIEVTNV